MTKFRHTLEMDTSAEGHPGAVVRVVFEQNLDDSISFYSINSYKPLDIEDLTHLEVWVIEDKKQWKEIN